MNTGVMVLQSIDGEGVAGSMVIFADCGHRVWIAPSGRAALLAIPMTTVCVNCIPAGPFETQMVPGAREELVAEMGEEMTDAAIEVVTAFGRAHKPRGDGH